jgi:hypothetical protein
MGGLPRAGDQTYFKVWRGAIIFKITFEVSTRASRVLRGAPQVERKWLRGFSGGGGGGIGRYGSQPWAQINTD